MPEREYTWLPRTDLLTFDELERVVQAFVQLGVDRVRLTGGEPLIRQDLHALVGKLDAIDGLDDLALTTNAILLPQQAPALRDAGLKRVTISLDTLREDRCRALAGADHLPDVLRGVDAAIDAGFSRIKLNTVVMRGTNDDELLDFIAYGRRTGVEVRFIEYMDVGGATQWAKERVFSRAEMLTAIAEVEGEVVPLNDDPSAPADRFQLSDGYAFGVISSTTEPFCAACDRCRITADGMLYLCLYAKHGLDLRSVVRSGASVADIAALLDSTWRHRTDQGAVDRVAMRERAPLADPAELRQDPHLEMHTRGG